MKVALILSCALAPPALAALCEGLTALRFPDARITNAQMVVAGTFVPPAGGSATAYKRLPEFCRGAVTLTPSSDSDIKAEVWLPARAGTRSSRRSAMAVGPERSATERWRTR
jgi:feruloyl esterase